MNANPTRKPMCKSASGDKWLADLTVHERRLGNKSRSVELCCKDFPTWRVTGKPESAGINRHVVRDERAPTGKESSESILASRPETARRGKTRNLHVLGFHPLLWAAQAQRSFHRLADYGEEANGREAQSHQGRASTPSAYPPNTMIHGQRVRCSCPRD